MHLRTVLIRMMAINVCTEKKKQSSVLLACVWRTAEIDHHDMRLPLKLESLGQAAVVTGTRPLRPVAYRQAHLSSVGERAVFKENKCTMNTVTRRKRACTAYSSPGKEHRW